MEEKKEALNALVRRDAIIEKEGELFEQYRNITEELDACRAEQQLLSNKVMGYMKNCVGKCFSDMYENDDLIWVYNDSKFGLTELRVCKDVNSIRQSYIDVSLSEKFVKSGFNERKGENNKEIFKHLLYETFQKIVEEAGLLDE